MATISARLQSIQERIREAESKHGRPPGSVQLLAVSKTWPAACVREAASAGQGDFGENYVQEGVDKVAALADLKLCWHFIGPLQSNKTRAVARHFDWVHSVDRLKIAERLAAARAEAGRTTRLNVCLQVNISAEASKSGISPPELPDLAQAVAALPQLHLRGLMSIPEPTQDPALQRRRFAALRQLAEHLQHQGLALDTLSMGMSDDFESAIAEGATMIRVGSAIFGQRHYPQSPPNTDGKP